MDTPDAQTLELSLASGRTGLPAPFAGGIVGTPGAHEAIERLGRALSGGERHIRLSGPPGVGKTLILDHFLGALRRPSLRIASASGRLGEAGLLDRLVLALRGGQPSATTTEALWHELAVALRLARLQGCSVVLGIDDAQELPDPRFLGRLIALTPARPIAASVIEVVQTSLFPHSEPDPLANLDDPAYPIVLRALTRTEAVAYIRAKLEREPVAMVAFTDAALTAIHALGHGLPRRLDRLVSMARDLAGRDTRPEIDVDLVNDASLMLAY
jgi:type II secretory pathway predicted ATPase ExeA